MNKIAFAAVALLIATGSAFAGSDHYGSDNVNQPAVTAPAGNGHWQASVTVQKPAEAGKHPMLVAFVQRAASGDILQSVALPLDGCASH